MREKTEHLDIKISDAFETTKKKFPLWLKILIFILEFSLVLTLLIIWLTSESVQESKNLWILFLYSFPSEFLIAIVPHEPVLLYFSKFYSPLTVTMVAIPGTLLTELLNYSMFRFVSDLNIIRSISQKKVVGKTIELFNRAPFLALWIAALTPIPFYPFRFLVVLARYPLTRYMLALFLSRTPRFFALAFLGQTIRFPDSLLGILFIALIIGVHFPFLRKIIKKKE